MTELTKESNQLEPGTMSEPAFTYFLNRASRISGLTA